MIKKEENVEKLYKFIHKNQRFVLNSLEYHDDLTEEFHLLKDYEVYSFNDGNNFGFIAFQYRDNDVYVPAFGLYAAGEDIDACIYHMYTHVSNIWVKNGFMKHTIDCIAIEEYFNSFLQLGFAQEQAYAVLDLNTFTVIDEHVSVRSLNKGDKALLRKMADIIYSYQNKAPVFASASAERVNEIRNGYTGLVDDEDVLFYIAEEEIPVAFAALWENDNGYLIPTNSIELTIVGTFIEMASKGIGTRLISFVMKDLIKRGFRWVSTDWRVTNIKSRRFWGEKCGFKTTKTRMVRVIEQTYESFDFSK